MTDHAELSRFQEIVQMSKSGAFADLKALIDGWVDEAHEQMIGSLSSTARADLSLRYQQRLCLKREIENFIDSANKGLEEITLAMRQDLDRLARENRPEYEYDTEYTV